MSQGHRADVNDVFRTHPNANEVSRHVTELPADYQVRRLEGEWIVTGPTGVFVVGRAGDDAARSAERTSALAHDLRARLSELIPWVPFVDAMIVTRKADPGLACMAVELDMLVVALTAGGVSIDAMGLAQLDHHIPGIIRTMEQARLRPLDPA